MTRAARLAALRLQGFKSFAERTTVELGPGINAVVGPNGSGKSNLADALRWALGEQGRALRSRKSEDVIFAGSDRRSAVGMADVTLSLDNADGLLPVDYGTVEIGRRLYRSGENEYLINRQRVRLRDLEDLLEGANLAENAFLFIGQGMVDQALALRPEERRPLFEEVAGVRRHDRRRRRAVEQLAEAEANVARVSDLIAELRPQARRLAAQAEQQESRARAGDDLAAALLAAGHHRWHETAGRVAGLGAEMARARAEADAALEEERAADAAVAAAARRLAEGDAEERERRAAHDAARARLAEIRLRRARMDAEADAVARERERLAGERAAADAAIAEHRRALALPAPPRDAGLDAELGSLDAARTEALAELSALRARRRAAGEELAAVVRAEEARRAEREAADRRAADLERRAAEARAEADGAASRAATLRESLAAAEAAREAAASEADAAAQAVEATRVATGSADAERSASAAAAAGARARREAAAAELAAADARIEAAERRSMARAARRLGGRALTDGLDVDPGLRAAVTAALRDAEQGFVLSGAHLQELEAEQGVLVLEDGPAGTAAERAAAERAAAGAVARATSMGGGALTDAIRRDPGDRARRLLARALWVPDLASAAVLALELGPGWCVATRDGALVDGDGVVLLGGRESSLARRAAVDRAAADAARAEEAAAAAEDALARAEVRADEARAALEAARATASAASASLRRAEEHARAAGADLERAAREDAWLTAQATRLAAEATRARSAAAEVAPDASGPDVPDAHPIAGGAAAEDAPDDADDAAIAAWGSRLAEVSARRDRVAARVADAERARAEADHARARAEAGATLAEERIATAERGLADLAARAERSADERRRTAAEESGAAAAEAAARSVLETLSAGIGTLRDAVRGSEEAVARARQRAHGTAERLRRLELGDVEARLALDAVREQLLVELAALGDAGLRALAAEAGVDVPGTSPDGPPLDGGEDDDADPAGAFEDLLARAGARWAAVGPPGESPSAGRLGALRRRFHDVGASNPFAVEEYAQIRARLDGLESQERDLRNAIDTTRALIRELEVLIAERFRSTFARLEGAFDEQFRTLFGGGRAQLSLTDPGDLAATGVEIVARPPGKKPQALAMLSGGERALTAVALLFAMLRIRPVPFCVLDEVDAALDEANIGRFSEALAELAASIQFIVITHNRGTIEAADALYGVTIGDDAVSRVISLRLEEARELAEAVRPGGAG
ncbi:MAG: chromosome segregation protein SMC [Chloroflexi bacterium]|nr:chromosome segregation protein SMC [Chloroflexota bacterium]